jgi:hypothetical protein
MYDTGRYQRMQCTGGNVEDVLGCTGTERYAEQDCSGNGPRLTWCDKMAR